MSIIQKICREFSFRKQCQEYNLGLWQCPSFLFLIMGLVIIAAMLSTYAIANLYTNEPEVVALLVIGTTLFLLILGHTIVNSFNHLAKVNKLKSEFVSVTSHQLRAPLANMKWILNYLMERDHKNIEKKYLHYFQSIKDSNERMIRLVNDLLDVSRIEGDSIKMRPQEISLVEIIKNVIEDLSILAKSSNVRIDFIAPPNLPKILADPERIRLVVQNIIDNAIKYIKSKGWVKINIQQQGKFLKVTVEDNGVGIPKKQQKQVFQKFFRSDNVMRYQVIGTGLGLFIAKAIIESSKGKIGFISKENQGSTFWFTLPIKS